MRVQCLFVVHFVVVVAQFVCKSNTYELVFVLLYVYRQHVFYDILLRLEETCHVGVLLDIIIVSA